MKILLTGSTGYIGRRLHPVLLDAGHTVVCFVRQRRRFDYDACWRDANYLPVRHPESADNLQVPMHGVLTDRREVSFNRPVNDVINNIWSIGGRRGWYTGNLLWRIRGLADTMLGGVGLRRGRRSDHDLKTGDALDFWRVLLADRATGRLVLYAEMKLPGEAWLEFVIRQDGDTHALIQTATFRPLGVWGRLYWYSVWPFHGLIFPKLARLSLPFRLFTPSSHSVNA